MLQINVRTREHIEDVYREKHCVASPYSVRGVEKQIKYNPRFFGESLKVDVFVFCCGTLICDLWTGSLKKRCTQVNTKMF